MDEMIEVLRITTESGAVYDFAQDMAKVRRANPHGWSTALRRDGEWIDVVSAEDIAFGKPMRLLLAGVAAVGDTLLVTTPVTMIERTWGKA